MLLAESKSRRVVPMGTEPLMLWQSLQLHFNPNVRTLLKASFSSSKNDVARVLSPLHREAAQRDILSC